MCTHKSATVRRFWRDTLFQRLEGRDGAVCKPALCQKCSNAEFLHRRSNALHRARSEKAAVLVKIPPNDDHTSCWHCGCVCPRCFELMRTLAQEQSPKQEGLIMQRMKRGAAALMLVLAGTSISGCSGGSLTTREKGAGIGALGGAAAGGDRKSTRLNSSH